MRHPLIPALCAVALVLTTPAARAAEDLLDRVETPRQARKTERQELGSRAKRIRQFNRRAVTTHLTYTTTYTRGGGSTTTREVEVASKKNSYDMDELADLTPDPTLKGALEKEARRLFLQKVTCFTRIGICLAGPVWFGGLLCAGGLLVGAVVDGAAAGSGGTLTGSVVALPVAGLVVGFLGGGIAGFASLFATGLLEALATPAIYYFLPQVPDEHFFLLAHQHNTRLAAELQLDPASLDPKFFPLRHAAQTGAGRAAREADRKERKAQARDDDDDDKDNDAGDED